MAVDSETILANLLSAANTGNSDVYTNLQSTLLTDLSVAPYYDDFDIENNYHRLLFRPGYPVQAREATQLQTMLQDQINRFGKHIFKEGSIVLGGDFSVETKFAYVKVRDVDGSNSPVDISLYLGQTIKSVVSGLTAYVYKVADGTETDADGNTKTIYVRYTNSGSNGEATFSNGETLTCDQGTLVVMPSAATGLGSIFVIREGILFAKDHFIAFKTQSCIVSRYDSLPTCRVGFVIPEEIVRFTKDASLLDPALESSNYAAPGADRLKLTPILTRLDINDNPGVPDYVDLIAFKAGVIQETFELSQYARIGDELARRTYDESGDYYVNGLTVRIREHLNNGENGGYLLPENGGDADMLVVGVEPGVAYVKGYQVSSLITNYIPIPKSEASSNVNGQVAASGLGNFFYCSEVTGVWPHDIGYQVDLYDTPQDRISSRKWSTSAAVSGNIIGNAKVKAVEFESGTLGTSTGEAKIYLFDIKLASGKILSNTRSLVNNTDKAIADIVLDGGNAVLQDTLSSFLLYNTGSVSTKTIRAADNSVDTSFIHKRTKDITISANGVFSIAVDDPTYETFPYGISILGTDEKRDMLLVSKAAFNIAMPAFCSVSTANGVVYGVGSSKFTRLNVGDKVEFAGTTNTYSVLSITSDIQMTVDRAVSATVANTVCYKAYKQGDIIDLTSKGVDAGITRAVSQSSSTSLLFDIKETPGTSVAASLTYRLNHANAKEIKKILRPNRYVIINTATAGTSGPYNLGVADIYKIRSIRQSNSPFSTVSDGTDVTSNFTLDTGQRDELYDHAAIIPASSLPASVYLLVCFDYFAPDFSDAQSVGYFSVDSYPINDSVVANNSIQTPEIPFYKSPLNGSVFDLRNYLDFRPIKINTAADATTLGAASTNPATTNSFSYQGAGFRMPAPDSQINYDFQFYLARRDIVCVDANGNFTTVQGVPSLSPITPSTPQNSMVIATIYVTPYPSLSTAYSNTLNRADLGCIAQKIANIRFTMRDIGVLKQRVDNLEYYTTLNTLEKQTSDLTILDSNGLDRFKNGIFVNTFRDTTLSAVNRSDYNIAIDTNENSIRPVYDMNSLYYDMIDGVNTTENNGLITLDYDEAVMWEFASATTYRNIETSVYRFVGTLELDPPTDVWVDTQTQPDATITTGSQVQGGTVLSQDWNAWQTKIVGYKLYDSVTNKLIGSYTNYSAAQAAASAYAGSTGYPGSIHAGVVHSGTGHSVIIETDYDNTRTGTQTVASVQTDTQDIGDRVTDVSIIPNIRPQTIKLHAIGMKPLTRYFTFFDGEDMSDYVTPCFTNYSIYKPIYANDGVTVTGFDQNNPYQEGDALMSNANGEVWGLLRIPADGSVTFRTGTKEVDLTDSPVNGEEATSTADAFFVAQGLTVTKQDTILTTRTVVPVKQSVTQGSTSQTSVVVNPKYQDCSAYSFFVSAPEGEEGLYLTSVDVWIESIDPNQGVWFEIREMDTSGTITRNQVPLSEVWFSSADIEPYLVSYDDVVANGAAAFDKFLKVKFKAPLFLYNNTEYAFVMHTIGVNPQTYFWMAHNGDVDLLTGSAITARPLTGTLFTTNNNLNWNEVTNWDLKVRFNRAVFPTNTVGTATLGIQSYAKPTIEGLSQDSQNYGETLICDKVTFSTGNINVGDIISSNINVTTTNVATNVSNTVITTVNVSVVANNGNSYYLVKPYRVPTTDTSNQTLYDAPIPIDKYNFVQYNYSDILKIGKSVNILNANGAPKTNATGAVLKSTISTINEKYAKLAKYSDDNAPRTKNVRDDRSTIISYSTPIPDTTTTDSGTTLAAPVISGSWEAHLIETVGAIEIGDVFYGQSSNTYMVISDINGFTYSVIDFEPAYLNFNESQLTWAIKSTANGTSPSLGSSFVQFDAQQNYTFTNEQIILSTTQEQQFLSNAKSQQIQVSMSTRSEYLSPIVDLGRTHSVFVDNLVNADTTDEDAPFGGNLINKYISVQITLADQQDAEDIHVVLSAYRPPTTDVKVWVKIVHNEDSDTLDQKDWVELVTTGNQSYSSLADTNDWVEYTYGFSENFVDRLKMPSANTRNATAQITINRGDQIVGINTAVASYVTGLRNGDIYIMDETGFQLGEKANVYNSAGGYKGNTIITSVGHTIHANSANNDVVEYTTDLSMITFASYKQFQIKIGLLATNPAIVPRVSDLQVVALQQ